MSNDTPATVDRAQPIVDWIYRWRWPLSALVVGLVLSTFVMGVTRVGQFSSNVAGLADTSNGSGAVKPLAFDPSMDVWFGPEDAAVDAFHRIENTFVAEDFVMVTFQAEANEQNPLGVFSRESLGTIARLTERFLTIPGVRHVRSLTYNPWIRWGTIADAERGDEEGLLISDLVEGRPEDLTDEQILERMVAVLGAQRTADLVGESRVRAVLGADANFADHIGEPLLLGTILSESATTTAIQVQILRPRVAPEVAEELFADEYSRRAGPGLSSIEQQRAAVRGIEHFLRLEKGLAIPTPELAQLQKWIDGLEPGEKQNTLQVQLADPTKNFMADANGKLVRKYYEYDPVGDSYADRTEPSDVVKAPDDFQPAARVPYSFHLGGVPLFERNFEDVGIADSKYVPLMFLVIVFVLLLVFRNISGIVIPLCVVFGTIMGMLGIAFASGELLNNLTMMAPNMLTAVGIADSIHLVAVWAMIRHRYEDRSELIREVLRRQALPVFLTSITTTVGFYSLTASSLIAVQMLGTMAAIGTLLAWALSMTLVPALLSIVPHRRKSQGPSFWQRLFHPDRVAGFVDRLIAGRTPVLFVSAIVFGVAVFGLLRVTVDSDFRSMFPDDNKVMSDFAWIEDRMGGVGDLELVFRGAQGQARVLTVAEEERLQALELRELGTETSPDEFNELSASERAELQNLRELQARWDQERIGVSTEFLASLDRFEKRLRSEMADPDSDLSVITDFVSPLDTLRKIHQVQNQNQAQYYRVPGTEDVASEARKPVLEYDEWTEEWSYTPAQTASTLVAQYYLQYESGARPGESLATELSSDRRQFRVQGRVVQASSEDHLRAFRRVEEIARTEFPELVSAGTATDSGEPSHSEFTISGKTLLFARTSDLFTWGFVKSMGIALSVITLMIGLLFRSFRFALISLIPNVMPIILPLSVFGLLGIPLDGPAILVSSIALGVCVDDTIHFFTKFARAERRGEDARSSLIYALTESGAAITITTLVLIIGFGTLLLSDFSPNFQMGFLAALMIGLAWIADFVVTAAVLSLFPTRELGSSVEPAAVAVASS